VTQLAEEGPGAKAGIKLGDVVTRLGDQPVKSHDDPPPAAQHPAGGRQARGGNRNATARSSQFGVTLGPRPADRNAGQILTAGFFRRGRGRRIKSPLLAEDIALQEDDVITLLDGKKTRAFASRCRSWPIATRRATR